MRRYQIALVERQEIAEALQRAQTTRAEEDCFPLFPVFPSWQVHRKLPLADNNKPAYVRLHDGLQQCSMLLRMWEHWAHMESIVTWTEVAVDDIQKFLESVLCSLSAKLHCTSFPFPLTHSWFDTLTLFRTSGHIGRDAMSTDCNFFTALSVDNAQQWTRAITHTSLLHANQEGTSWVVTPTMCDLVLSQILTATHETNVAQRHNASFDHGSTVTNIHEFCGLASKTDAIRGVFILPTSAHEAIRLLTQTAHARNARLHTASFEFQATALHPAARIRLPDNDSRVQVWIYESELMRQTRPIDASCVVATLGQQLKQVGAHVHRQDLSSVTTPSPPQGQAFVAFAASQARARHAALNPECKLQANKHPKWWSQPHKQWTTVGKSWDEVNRNLHLSPHSWVRKIHHMRKVTPRVSVFQEGTWIYILWSTTSGLCYIGQTGAKCNARTLHKRGMEHIRCALGYKNIHALLHTSNNHLAPRNVYKHIPLSTTRRTESTFFVRQK